MACPAAPMIALTTRTMINATAIQFTCMPGYSMYGDDTVYCYNGIWGTNMPQCLMSYESHVATNIINRKRNFTSEDGGFSFLLISLSLVCPCLSAHLLRK